LVAFQPAEGGFYFLNAMFQTSQIATQNVRGSFLQNKQAGTFFRRSDCMMVQHPGKDSRTRGPYTGHKAGHRRTAADEL
jgi:hypothetical protein